MAMTFQSLSKVFIIFLHLLSSSSNSFSFSSDDLDVAPDFFEYFAGTFPLLRADKSLWCISAWNDNGKQGLIDETAPDLLYRSDFFPGLGWMLSKELWEELSKKTFLEFFLFAKFQWKFQVQNGLEAFGMIGLEIRPSAQIELALDRNCHAPVPLVKLECQSEF